MIAEAYKTRFHYADAAPVEGPLNLSLFFSESQITYAIFGENNSRLIELADLSVENVPGTNATIGEKMSFVTGNFHLLRRKFEKTFITFLSQDFSILPEAYNASGFSANLLEFSAGKKQRRIIREASNGVQMVAGLDPEVFNFIEKNFPNALIRHAGTLTMSLMRSQHSLRGSDIFLNLHQGMMEICCFRGSSLHLYNCFQWHTDEDILYYLLFAAEQFGIDPQNSVLVLAGERAVDSPLFEALKKYFAKITYAVHDPGLRVPGDLPSHFYFTLLSQHLCA